MIKRKGYNEPLYEITTIIDVNELTKIFSFKKDLMVLNSAMVMDGYGDFSFICFDAFSSFYSKGLDYYWNNERISISDPFNFINERIIEYKIKKVDCIPPLQGGVVGYFGYEAGHYLEDLPYVIDNIKLPDIYLNFYTNVISIDHSMNKCWIISTGLPEKNEYKRVKNAKKNILDIKRIINEYSYKDNVNYGESFKQNHFVRSNFTRESYVNAVEITKEYIMNGDIFEANISQQFNVELTEHINSLELYFKLIKINPAPFSAYIKIHDDGYIISSSPERFIKLTNQLVETCPIKGTRKRSVDIDEDKRLKNELLSSEKDHAENIMIVDLMRNDISRVCQLNSIKVNELCALKSFETVHHLVSKVTGELKINLNAIDLMKATFPPGSVTGAPKIRSMEIISELEKQERGPYCGCIGYISFTGDMDTSVIIRTYFLNKNKLFFSAGGAIVLDSNPEEEYQESLTKAQALIKALTQ